eukprot:scaffold38356_cov237-Amphora_coffeaeformis.AAC.3
MKISLCCTAALVLATTPAVQAWIVPRSAVTRSTMTTLQARVGIFYGTSTGSTMTCAEAIYEAFGPDLAAEPVDIETLDAGQIAAAFGQHDALVVGTPTWNTGAETERSGTGWDDLYYAKLPALQQTLAGKPVAVFGLGDQISYSDNYADGTGELYDVFESLGCHMMGAWSQEGYEHDDSKAIRGDKFCGLLLDMVNQEDLTEERVQQWVAQLQAEGFCSGSSSSTPAATVATTTVTVPEKELKDTLEEYSDTLDESIALHSSGGFLPHTNLATGKTMWTSADGRSSFVTQD